MPARLRLLAGTLALIAFVLAYGLVVMALSASRLTQLGWGVALAFYATAGLAWVLPAGLIIRWMQRR